MQTVLFVWTRCGRRRRGRHRLRRAHGRFAHARLRRSRGTRSAADLGRTAAIHRASRLCSATHFTATEWRHRTRHGGRMNVLCHLAVPLHIVGNTLKVCDLSTRNSQSRRIVADHDLVARLACKRGHWPAINGHNARRLPGDHRWRLRRFESGWSIHQTRLGIPRHPDSAGLPCPTEAGYEQPGSVVVR